MNLILFQRCEVSANDPTHSIELSCDGDKRFKHISQHLRKRHGDSIQVGVINGAKGQAIFEHTDGKTWKLEFRFDASWSAESLSDTSTLHKSSFATTLVLAMPFPKRLQALWSPIASMGVTRICIVRGALSDQVHGQSSILKPEKYEPLLMEGLAQGMHTLPVQVDVQVSDGPVSMEILERLGLVSNDSSKGKAAEAKIFLDCGDEEIIPPPARQAVLNQFQSKGGDGCLNTPSLHAIVAIGPERGWTDAEAKLFQDAGFQSASLGPSILRVDTAIIAGLGIVQAAMEEQTH